jgi:cyclopropane-fatty-acyl-phospholipid synthase
LKLKFGILVIAILSLHSNRSYGQAGKCLELFAPKTNMAASNPEKVVAKFFAAADIKTGGDRPEDITINDTRFYERVLRDPTLQLGETYMDGLWESKSIDKLISKLYLAQQQNGLLKTFAPLLATPVLAAQALSINMYRYARDFLMNRQTRTRSKQVAEEHYDLGNDLYSKMLDPTLAYTSGVWGPRYTLEDAQLAKYDLLARKMNLKPGQHILDIGCGFGGFARYAAKYYGVKVTGISISIEQLKLARALSEGYPGVEFIYSDYRDIKHRFKPDTFDHVVSVEMVEAVGVRNLEGYFEAAYASLKDGGRFVMQAISNRRDMYGNNPWMDKYIFPNGVAPSNKQYDKGSQSSFGAPVYRHSITRHYDFTTMAWYKNTNDAWAELQSKYGSRFKRMWDFYLLGGAAVFRVGQVQLDQVVYVKGDHRESVKPVEDIPSVE